MFLKGKIRFEVQNGDRHISDVEFVLNKIDLDNEDFKYNI
jgi:hypothetical protein